MTNGESIAATISCGIHGNHAYALICSHLASAESIEYFRNVDEPDYHSQAWCKDCDAALQTDKGWNQRASDYADWRFFCHLCFEERLGKNILLEYVDGADE